MKKPSSAPRRTRRGERTPAIEDVRERLLAARQVAIAQLARLGFAAGHDDASGTGESPFEEGDVAQASERLDMSFMQRERVAERINRLTRALERVAQGRYGTCEDCSRGIEPARLAAAPEATVCRDCQGQRERGPRAADGFAAHVVPPVRRLLERSCMGEPQASLNLPGEPTTIPPAIGHSSGRSWPVQQLVSWMTDPGPGVSSGRAPAKDPVAVELGRRGGLKGGKARAARLSPKRRVAIARRAARARWAAARERAS